MKLILTNTFLHIDLAMPLKVKKKKAYVRKLHLAQWCSLLTPNWLTKLPDLVMTKNSLRKAKRNKALC